MKKNSRRTRKIRNLVLICVLSAVLLTVSTYAWFIGMQTVNVKQFEIEIASVDGLMLSMDGKTWATTVQPGATAAYENNTNQFLTDTGLIPMSSVGEFDLTTSRLKIYEKGSLTATAGGYRLMASRVENTTQLTVEDQPVAGQYSEKDGYVAFDLFVMNLSGEAYYENITDPSNEEAIYLTYDSKVDTKEAGDQSGIENSVRVAFAQIGRVSATEYGTIGAGDTDKLAKVTGMTCNLNEGQPAVKDDITGICRDAAIWEPNERDHVDAAVTWYNKTCKTRTGSASSFAYGAEACADLTAKDEGGKTQYYTTNAISDVIAATDYVDVYDGEYNGFSHTAGKMELVDTFTDTEKLVKGNQREELLTLAPNSITKIRVYIWLEGQDVDNYDFASLGKVITVNFGFTKERFTSEEIDEDMGNVPSDAEKLPEQN